MDKAYPLSTPMVVRLPDVTNDPFRQLENGSDTLGPELPYLSAIGALMYLSTHIWPDIAFSVNLLARCSSWPTRRDWNGVNHILYYLQSTKDMGLYFSNKCKEGILGFVVAGYLFDSHNGQSQTRYVFMCGGVRISWLSMVNHMDIYL
jgi:hypothetical protein